MPDDRAEPVVDVTAVVLAHNRRDAVGVVLERLRHVEVDEILVVDSGSTDGTGDLVRAWERRDARVRLLDPGCNVAIAGRNLAARAAHGRYLLMLDDDSYPLPGAVRTLRDTMERHPAIGVLGGLVRAVDTDGNVVSETGVGTFDWWLSGGRSGQVPPPAGWPAFFFAEGGCLIRRDAYLEVGGFFEPYFFSVSEIDLATRLLAAGWDVRYLPAAVFDHLKVAGLAPSATVFHYRVRNQIWYFWLRFPALLAAVRIPTYLLFDLVLCLYHRALPAWTSGIAAAWKRRDRVRPHRAPVPRRVVRRAELNRGQLHLRLLAHRLLRKIAPGRARTDASA